MTEFEITESLNGVYAMMSDSATMYFALVSGYLAASYVAGAKFTTRQVSIINVLFVLWTLGNVNSMFSGLVSSQRLMERLAPFESAVFSNTTSVYISTGAFLFVQVGGIVASLYFMWSVRHPKAE